MLRCVDCGRTFNPEGWDPLGGDCPVVVDEDGTVIIPTDAYANIESYVKGVVHGTIRNEC
jgi:hypothetical protein